MLRALGSALLTLIVLCAAPSARAQTQPDTLLVNRNSGMCVEIPRGNAEPGIWAVQYPCKDLREQRWTLTRAKSDYVIRNAASGRCLEIIDASTQDGHSVNQAVCDGSRKQVFRAEPIESWVRLVTVGGLCVDLRDASIDDGGLLIQRPCGGASSQKWTLYGRAQPSAWSSKISLPLVPVAAATLRNGKILVWSAYDRFAYGGDQGKTYSALYDPATNRSTERLVSSTGHDMFCPGTATLPDGRILVNGGSSSAKTSIYDPATDVWTTGAPMNVPRGYQGDTVLGTGEVLTIGGSWSGGEGGKLGEIWSPARGWRTLPGVPAEALAAKNDPGGIYRSDNHMWLFGSSFGYAFHAGPGVDMNWIRTTGGGAIKSAGPRGDDVYSMNGNVVMYDAGKLLKLGGAPAYELVRAVDGVYSIDFAEGPFARVKVAKQRPMAFARAFVNSVVLPTGDVVVIGGQNYAQLFSDYRGVYIPEIWRMRTGTFERLAAMTIPRNYHSVATLMLDGRVWVGGGGLCGDCPTNHPDAQILTPPYLLNADGSPAVRPAITTTPATAGYGARVSVTTDREVASFAMIRLNAVTHSVNNDQRRISIPIEATRGTTYTLRLPSDRGVLLPGDWMLFAMTKAGVPSIAKIVRVQ
ncbi:RICIN domain-containing protein [Methylopila turkensis]|uniref:Sugar-binding protein n=1 Tax=Methylopila turkensis TaxID=1437816 RepID=A0A9W6JJU0_9HYPH|nr:RICIN domain-containing protein [Methylopila turkensis]GLK78527.1 sugar-binding protein [Methylopila turkensis]